jgi:hypothetical protein
MTHKNPISAAMALIQIKQEYDGCREVEKCGVALDVGQC